MRHFAQSVTIMGRVESTNPDAGSFQVKARSGDMFPTFVNVETSYQPLRNLDELNQDRFLPLNVPQTKTNQAEPSAQIKKYLIRDSLVVVEGIYQEDGAVRRLDARTVHVLTRDGRKDHFLFEETHWWLSQIDRLGNQWLEDLFGAKMAFDPNDFSRSYQTNLNILGLPADDGIQEMATLSRLIYGLSSAYLLTGVNRYLLAAQAGIEFQRESFRYMSHDGLYCFWAYGRQRGRYGSKLIKPSLNPDDLDTIPLYEQIYALAGLAQFYRITSNWEVLEDIRRTVRMFNAFYLDRASASNGFPGLGGYFSHIDYATFRPDSESLGKNQSRKNWNSNGDHIPAYLVNLILALDPLPQGCDRDLELFLEECITLLETSAKIILEKFPDPDPAVPYVNERFHYNWKPDHKWGWQQNRAVCGHNCKIAWNLTRVSKYFLSRSQQSHKNGMARQAESDKRIAEHLIAYSKKLGEAMAERGYDQIRGGLYDCVEREPKNGLPIEFAWMDTKDFWQQEQAILAYLILQSVTEPTEPVDATRLSGAVPRLLKDDFLALSREMEAFWNLYFLDHDDRGIYQRVFTNGVPQTQGNYGQKGAHSISGYHAFELNFLAHIYNRALVPKPPESDSSFSLFFRPEAGCRQLSINVLPDFFAPGEVEVTRVSVRGVDRPDLAARARDYLAETPFQITLRPDELDSEIIVEFCGYPDPKKRRTNDGR